MPFADELIGRDEARRLRDVMAVPLGRTPPRLSAAVPELDDLALRARADLLRDALLSDVPGTYSALAEVIREATSDPRFTGWLIWPVTSAVASRAVEDGSVMAFDDAMELLAELTPRLTSEFAIRTLLRARTEHALETMIGWTASADEHVRRLASEGSRPFLPWSIRVSALIESPDSTRPILDALYRDPSEFVRRSVANHLNDLSRIAPDLTVRIASSWLEMPDENTTRVVRHGLRTLVKKGDPAALALLGFSGEALRVDEPALSATVIGRGEAVAFAATIHNDGPVEARVAVDYVIHHRKTNGSTSPKTFKLTVVTVPPGQAVDVRRTHSFREISTRRYHPGAHAVAVTANGVSSDLAWFDLR